MLDRRALPSLIAPLAAALVAMPTLAQTPDTTAAPVPTRPAGSRGSVDVTAASNPGPLVTVEFPGGTVRQFVDAIRAAAGQGKINVIMPKEAESIILPELSLRDVTAYTALQALEFAANQDAPGQLAVGRIDKGEGASATFAIKYATRSQMGFTQPTPAPAKLETRVFSIRELVEPPTDIPADPTTVVTTETVLNAIEAASRMDAGPKAPAAELMLHKDSMLLIVRGTADQQRTIELVLGQITQSVASKRARALEADRRDKASKLEESELRVQTDVNNSQIRQAEAMLAKTTDEVERAKKLNEQGQVSATELQNLQASLVGAREALEQAFATRRGLQERAAIMEVRRQSGVSTPTGESPVSVIYNIQDLEPFESDIYGLCKDVGSLDKSSGDVRITHPVKGTIVVRATPGQHRVLVHALNAIRRAKSNEPKLPGLDADDLIRKGEGK